MFYRRRASSNPHFHAPPTPTAALAASQAFLKSRESNASLSSAAAAAALRTHATTPTPVGDVQTKRMVRRGSTSSLGSAGSQLGPGLRRQSSSGSMSERTFRTPSPNRSSPVVEADPNAPPVPAVPNDVPYTSIAHRRTSSLEPPFRGASPGHRRGGGRGVSVDRGTMGPVGRGHAAQVSTLSQVPEVDRENSTRSINFSRPMSPPISASYTVGPGRTGHSGWFTAPIVSGQTARDNSATRPKTSDGLPANDISGIQQAIHNAADKPVVKRKSKTGYRVEGARLASGTIGNRPTGTALHADTASHVTRPVSSSPGHTIDPKSPSSVYDPSTRTFKLKQEPETRRAEPIQRPIERPRSPASQQISEPPRSPPVQRIPEQPRSPPASPPAFQTRAGALQARQSSEDYGAEDQEMPIPGTNTSRKLDTAQVPDDHNRSSVTTAPTPLSTPEPHNSRATSQPVIQTPANIVPSVKGRGSVRGERPQSLSPGRSAHFATVAVEMLHGVRHQPPPRSISPAKSALKHSPSSSIRTGSPVTNNITGTSRKASSEASDTMSEDGSRQVPKKKRNVRVSFDEDAVVAGTSAYAQSPSSPKGLHASKWSPPTQASGEDDLDEVMKPRPALPSFGSIRERPRRSGDEDSAEKVTEIVHPSMSASVSTISEPLEASSDHAIAGVIAQEFASRAKSHAQTPQPETTSSFTREPLPPEVTSVEGSGYVSDSEQSAYSQDEKLITEIEYKANGKDQTHVSRSGLGSDATEESGNTPKALDILVPSIAVLPATPAAEDKLEDTLMMPGGFPEQFEELEAERKTEGSPQDAIPYNTNRHHPTGATLADAGISEPSPRDASPSHISEELADHDHGVSHGNDLSTVREDSEESDSSSIYSDAAEDFADADEGAYASIDAVVESPIVSPVPGLAISTPPESPVSPPRQSRIASALIEQSGEVPSRNANGDWNATKEYWSGLSEARKQQIEHEARAEPTEGLSAPAVVPVLQPATPKKTRAAATRKPSEPVEASRQRQNDSQPRITVMKKSMRPMEEPSAPETRMKKTMRTGGPQGGLGSQSSETQMRKSMRSNDTMPTSMRGDTGLAASRHAVPPVENRAPRGALQKRNIPPAVVNSSKVRSQTAPGPHITKGKPSQPPPLITSFSNDSDSDASASSFRRQRPRTSGAEAGKYTMRRSMRGGAPQPMSTPVPTMKPSYPSPTLPPLTLRTSMRVTSPTPAQGGPRSSRFGIRSLSPTGTGGIMGRSRRNPSIDSASPTLRSPGPPQKLSSKIPGFGKSSKAKPVSPTKAIPRFKSKFRDSSDEEDDDRPRRFQSRFADSDEEDEDFQLPAGLTPVRGIPRKPGEEDRESTDLSDEESDTEPIAAATSSKDIEKGGLPAPANSTAQGAILAGGSLRDSKYAVDQPNGALIKREQSKRGFFGLGKKKTHTPLPDIIGGSETIPTPASQQARPLTPIGEDKALEAGTQVSPATPEGARSPKLQRRNTPQWGSPASDSWPLSQPPRIGEEVRPQSSEGVIAWPKTSRLGLSKRSSSAVVEPRLGVDPKTGKEVVIGRTGKKKRFPMLRKAFGLND